MKKKCVLLLTRFSCPPLSGYKLKTYHLIKILSRIFDLHVIIITDEQENEQTDLFLKAHCVDYKIFHFPKYRFYINTLNTLLFSKKPLQVGYFYFPHLKKYIERIIHDADFVIPSLTRTTEYAMDTLPETATVLDMVDSYALSYTRSTNKTNSLFWKWMYKLEGDRLMKYEEKLVSHFDTTLLVNRDEVAFWKKYGNCIQISNGVDEKLFQYQTQYILPEKSVAFFGKMDYPPNVDAVKWYLKNVHSLLPKDFKFYIVGISPSSEIMKLSEAFSNVIVTGFIQDPYILLSQCLAIIAPMQTGGGIQNKVLEAMALGQANILSTLAASPIGGISGTHYLIADKAEEYLLHINKLSNDLATRKNLGINARAFIQKNYSWKIYEDSLREILK